MTINLPEFPLLPLLLMKDDTIYYRFKCYPVVYDENFDYDIIKKFSIVIVDSRLSDLIIEVSFDKPNLLIFDTSKQNCVLTLFQYVTRKTFYVEKLINSTKISSTLFTILLLQRLKLRARVDTITEIVSKQKIIDGYYNIDNLIANPDLNPCYAQKLNAFKVQSQFYKFKNMLTIIEEIL